MSAVLSGYPHHTYLKPHFQSPLLLFPLSLVPGDEKERALGTRLIHLFNILTPGNFAQKCLLRLIKRFLVFLVTVIPIKTLLTLTIMSKYWSYTLQPSDPDAKYWLTKFRHAQKAKFRVEFNQ